MVRLGWISDTHVRPSSTDTPPGATTRFTTDLDKLNNKGATDIFFTGDAVHPVASGDVPHVPTEAYDRFWAAVNASADPSLVRHAIPGNHDIPIQGFMNSDERVVLRERIDYPDSGVTVCLINTHATGVTTGSPGARSGIGETIPRCSRADLEWLDAQLADAGTNAKVVIPHAVLHPLVVSRFFNGNAGFGSEYEYIKNWEYCHSILSSYNKVVVPQSHLHVHGGAADETKTAIDGVQYVRTQHYYDDPNDVLTTFGWIDVDSASCTITTEEHTDGTQYTPLNVTF